MNLNKVLDELQDVSPEALETKSPRRNILKTLGTKVAMVSIPVLGSAIFNSAKAQSKATIVERLNRLIKLEHIKAEFYSIALSNPGVVPEEHVEAFTRISEDQAAHVTYLSQIVTELDGVPEPQPTTFDTTGGRGTNSGGFYDALTSQETFLKLIQTLADFSVRAYKGQIYQLASDKPAMQAAINIHSSEARTASYIRRVRGLNGWITESESGIDIADAQIAYGDENNTIQYGIQLIGINGFNLEKEAATEAFDEPVNELELEDFTERFVP